MSTHSNDSKSGAAEAVRKAFSALPFEQKISTLIRVELDMLGDAVDAVVSAASKAANEISKAFTSDDSPATDASSASGGARTS